MQKPVKTYVKRAIWSTGGLVCALIAYFTLLAFPEPIFSNTLQHGNFRFYSRTAIDPSVCVIADEAAQTLSRSEIYDAKLTYRVFVTGNPSLHKFLNGPGWRSMARNYEFGNPIYVPLRGIRQAPMENVGLVAVREDCALTFDA